MVRNYKKKRVTKVIEEDVNNAVLQVANGLMRPNEAAITYNIKRNTLHYRIKKHKNLLSECGQLITMCGIGNAIGNFIPPVFIFPRAWFHDNMIKGGPPGCVGYANSPTSSWMTGPLFLKVLE